ncbi:MAG: hypothetical protein AMS27_02215 [Bacteroides sp. SM23_62_1]|nr:MAG: hypothetical protein AMS27_02215 [Bacteroides sp. SM23_62_1]
MKKSAQIISILFHPLLMPSLGFLILFNSGTYLSYLPAEYKKMILLIVILCTLVIPISMIPFFLYQKIIFSVQMSERRERFVPLILSFLLFLFCYYLLMRLQIPPPYKAFSLGCMVSVLAAFIITSKWKISAHMIGNGGITGLITYLIFYLQINLEIYLIIIIVVAGLTGAARMILDAHKPSEIYSGFIVGFTVISLIMLMY